MRGSLMACPFGFVLLTAGLAAWAAAAKPEAAKPYSGSGVDYVNGASKWSDAGEDGQITFKTSTDRRRILAFHGTYANRCGAGVHGEHSSYIKATFIDVSRTGHFAYDFSFPDAHASRGHARIYVAISGDFIGDGSIAKLSYLVDTVFNGLSGTGSGGGRPVRHPFSTSEPGALGCAAWVKATVTAR